MTDQTEEIYNMGSLGDTTAAPLSSASSTTTTTTSLSIISRFSSPYFDEISLEYPPEEMTPQQAQVSTDHALWDGVFWLEACLAMSQSVRWFQLSSIAESVREEAFRAGIWFSRSSHFSD